MTVRPHRFVGGLRPGKTAFDLSYEKKYTCDMGQLIPVCIYELMPGDHIKFGNQSIVRFQPLVAPILHEVLIQVYYFAVPIRVLWDGWEKFITGGQDGNDNTPLPRYVPEIAAHIAPLTIWDYLEYPTNNVDFPVDEDTCPVDFPLRAYNMIYNEYFRDQDLQPEVDIVSTRIVHNSNWEKEYFTTSRPFQQRGVSPGIPVNISGSGNASFMGSFQPSAPGAAVNHPSSFAVGSVVAHNVVSAASSSELDKVKTWFNNNLVDFSSASVTSFTPSELRLAFQIQKWQERNARAGVRYTEFLRAHFGVTPNDDRLQRPEYCGGSKSTIVFSEVLQTSESGGVTPQGNMAGHGIGVSDSYCGRYFAEEFCIFMGIARIVPKPSYQQGINRQWLRRTRFDYPFPEFVNLSEQAIERGEIYWTGKAVNDLDLFGYQGRYDELRIRNNVVCGLFRDTLDYWHLGRKFATPPYLNSDFITCKPDKRIFAVQDENGILVSFANLVKGIRPLPAMGEPGLLDHH